MGGAWLHVKRTKDHQSKPLYVNLRWNVQPPKDARKLIKLEACLQYNCKHLMTLKRLSVSIKPFYNIQSVLLWQKNKNTKK